MSDATIRRGTRNLRADRSDVDPRENDAAVEMRVLDGDDAAARRPALARYRRFGRLVLRRTQEMFRPSVSPLTRPFRAAVSYRGEWDRLSDVLRAWTPDRLRLDARAAGALADRLRWRYAWYLGSTERRRPERLELMFLIGGLEVIARRTHTATSTATEALQAWKEVRGDRHTPGFLRVARREAWFWVRAALLMSSQGSPDAARRMANKAWRTRLLDVEDWSVLRPLLDPSTTVEGFLAALNSVHDLACHGTAPDVSHAAEEVARGIDSMASGNPDLQSFRWRQLAAVQHRLSWPVVAVAEREAQEGDVEQAGRKIERFFGHLDEELRPRASFLIGQAAFLRGEFRQADEHFARALEGGTDVSAVYEFMGVAKANLGAYAEALALLERASEGAADDDYLLLQRANVLVSSGDPGRAAELYRRLLDRDAANADAIFGLGKVAEVTGDEVAAAAAYDRVLASRPDHAAARFSAGVLRMRAGDVDGAHAAFERVFETSSSHLPTRVELGVLGVQQGLAGDATGLERGLRHLEVCWERHHRDDRVAYWRGRGLAAAGRFDECLDAWDVLRRNCPNDKRLALQIAAARFARAIRWGQEGSPERAIDVIEGMRSELLGTYPVDEVLRRLHLDRAMSALLEGNDETCRAHLERVTSMAPCCAEAALLRALIDARDRTLDPADLDRRIDGIDEGVPKQVLRLLAWAWRLTAHREEGPPSPLRETDASSGMPDVLAADPTLNVLRALQDLFAGSIANEEKQHRLDQVVSMLRDERAARAFPGAELGWWLGSELSALPGASEWLERAAETDPPSDAVRIAIGVVATRVKRVDLALAFLESIGPDARPELQEYVARAYGSAVARDVARLQREPGRLREIARHLERITRLTEAAA